VLYCIVSEPAHNGLLTLYSRWPVNGILCYLQMFCIFIVLTIIDIL